MGFLERLRQEREARERAIAERLRLERERQERLEAQSREQNAERERQWMLRRENTIAFYQRSGIGILVRNLHQLVEGSEIEDNVVDYGNGKEGIFGSYDPIRAISAFHGHKIEQIDPDSAVFDFRWNQQFHSGDRRSESFFVIEVTPNGTIGFYTGSSFWGNPRWARLPVKAWESNRGILENALEQVYRRPGTRSWVQREPKSYGPWN